MTLIGAVLNENYNISFNLKTLTAKKEYFDTRF